MGLVITVSGAVGGIGTSTFAWALAQQPAEPGWLPVLIDAQPDGAPLDLTGGAEQIPGIRWSQVRIRSTDIAAETIVSSLPTHHGVAVLSADAGATADPIALGHLVEVLRSGDHVVVLDLPARHALREAMQPKIDVMLLPPTMGGIVAAFRSMRPATQFVVVDIGRGDLLPDQLAEQLGRPPLGVVRWQRAVAASSIAGTRIPAGTDVMRLAAGILGTDGHVLRTA